MRIMKLALAALFAVLAFSAMAAATAFAAHPSILTQSGNKLLVSSEGSNPVLRGLNAGVLGTITCEKVLFHGFLLSKTPLIDEIKLLFHGKCKQEISGNSGTCTEPIHVNVATGELGLLTGTKTVGVYIAPQSGTTFVTVSCTNGNTTVEGSVVGEIPEKVGTTNQYNKQLSSITTIFESVGKNSDGQKFTSIELLGTSMTGDELKVSGFFGGKASEEATSALKGDGTAEICTLSSCP